MSAAQSAFVNVLVKRLATSAPDVNPLLVLGTGATQIRTVFTAEQVPGILIAYMDGIKTSLAIAVGAVGLSFIVSLFYDWKKLDTEAVKSSGAA